MAYIQNRFRNGDPVMTMELVGLLVNCAKKHKPVDRAYGPYLKAKGMK